MIQVEKRRRVVNPGRRRKMSMVDKLAFVRRMKRARGLKANPSRRKNKKYAKSMIRKLTGRKAPKFLGHTRVKRRRPNVSSIITVYPAMKSSNPGRRKRRTYKRKVNKGAVSNMATRRRRRTYKARVTRRRRRHNVVYRKRIKRGMYAYSSNPGRRRRRHYRRHNVARRHNVRRRRYNPGIGVGGGVVTKVLGVIGGVAVTKLLCGFLPASLATGPLGYISTGIIAVAQGKLVGKFSKNAQLGNDMMIGGLAYLAAKVLNDFFPSIGSYTGISGMGLIGPSSFYNPQVNVNGSMGSFQVPAAVMGAIPMAPAAASASLGRLRRTGRVM